MFEKGLVFHKKVNKLEESIKISDSAYITSNLNILNSLMMQETKFKLVLGHAGWSEGQLENELKNGDWLVQDANEIYYLILPQTIVELRCQLSWF